MSELEDMRRQLQQSQQAQADLQRQLTESQGGGGRGGGGNVDQRGAVMKLACPSLDDAVNYLQWKKSMRIWKAAATDAKMTDAQKATAVIATINNDHKIKKDLHTGLLNHLTDAQCDSPTLDVVEAYLESQLKVDSKTDTHKVFQDWAQCRINQGELYTDFTIRWD